MKDWATCPRCGAKDSNLSLVDERETLVYCSHCGEQGTVGYFTPVKPVEPVERIVTRTFDVPGEADNARHVLAVNAAMQLLAFASSEENLDLDWGTLRLIAGKDDAENAITYVAVIKGYERRHQVGGVAVSTSDGGAKVYKPLTTDEPSYSRSLLLRPDEMDIATVNASKGKR